jgi:hypothetical protein
MSVKMINRAVSMDMGHMTVRVNELTDYEVEPNVKAYELSLQYERQTLKQPTIWIENAEDLVALADALNSYIEMRGFRKEASHE